MGDRKPVLIVSSLCMALSAGGLAILLLFGKDIVSALPHLNVQSAIRTTIPVTLFSLYMLGMGLGVGTYPWSLAGELTPKRLAPLVSGLCVFLAYLSLYASTQSFIFLKDAFTLAGPLIIYAIVCFVFTIVVVKYFPRTRGKSIEEIHGFFEDENEK